MRHHIGGTLELNELKALMAASVVGGRLSGITYGLRISEVTPLMVEQAVSLSQKIWEEVLKQERE